MHQYIVRPARDTDKNQIISLYKRVSQHSNGLARRYDEITEAYVQHFMGNAANNGIEYVAEHTQTNTIVGEIHCYPLQPAVLAHVLGELTIAVDPGFQQQGIGKALFQTLLKEVEENRKDILRVELIARESNKKAIAFYQSLGFTIEGRLANRIRSASGGFEDDIPMGWMNRNYATEQK
jgi:ribosomal protein S18 acetylase RimI-like enzyme